MERDQRKDAHTPGREQDPSRRLADDLLERSRRRLWWSSARVAMRRGQAGEPPTLTSRESMHSDLGESS